MPLSRGKTFLGNKQRYAYYDSKRSRCQYLACFDVIEGYVEFCLHYLGSRAGVKENISHNIKYTDDEAEEVLHISSRVQRLKSTQHPKSAPRTSPDIRLSPQKSPEKIGICAVTVSYPGCCS